MANNKAKTTGGPKPERQKLKHQVIVDPWSQLRALRTENKNLRQHLDYQIERGNKQAEQFLKMQASGKIVFDDNAPDDGEIQAVVPLQKAQASIERVTKYALDGIQFVTALGEVQMRLGQLELLACTNGGEQTAVAFGICSDGLTASINQFERAVGTLAKNGVEDIRQYEIRGLLDYCRNLRSAANSYTTAKPTDRSAIQTRITKIVVEAKPFIASLYRSQNQSETEIKIVAEMLMARIDKEMSYLEALKDIRQSDPALCLRIFSLRVNDEIDEEAQAHARKLVSRYRRGEL